MNSQAEPLIRVVDLKKHYPVRRGAWGKVTGAVRAVDGVNLVIRDAETLGVVGESGCGKTTLGRLMLNLLDATSGEVYFRNHDLRRLGRAQMRLLRRRMQIVFQDPYSSLNPRMKAGRIIGEGLRIHGLASGPDLGNRVIELLELVGLPSNAAERYPHEFSGGQRQRICIARALAVEPEFIVADEPVSALDVSVQAQIVNLLQDIQRELGLTYLFIAHDLSVVKQISDRIAVMYLGKIVEIGTPELLYEDPSHPYTRALLAAVPVPDPGARRRVSGRQLLGGDVPNPAAVPPGCRFHPRCPERVDACRRVVPELMATGGGREVACLLRQPGGNAAGTP